MYHKPTHLLPLLSILLLPPTLSASPLQPPITNTSTLPTHYGLLIFPHYQALDIFGPMDLLNSLFLLYSNSTAVPKLSVLSRTMEPVTSAMTPGGFGQEIVPTTTFERYLCEHGLRNSTAPAVANCTTVGGGESKVSSDNIDVLVVPGGGGTRRDMSAEIAFVRTLYPSLKYIVSICTGATLLSRAGVLEGKRATTNKRSWKWATSHGENITWVPTARWVEDGNVFSSSGISAGTDAMYAFVSKVYGDEVSRYMGLSLEYNRVTEWDDDPFAKVWDVPGAV